jgi:hypothetical protein
MNEAEFKDLVAQAKARYDALSPAAKKYHDYEQRRSFVRGMCPSKRNYEAWCLEVDKLLPPMDPPL